MCGKWPMGRGKEMGEWVWDPNQSCQDLRPASSKRALASLSLGCQSLARRTLHRTATKERHPPPWRPLHTPTRTESAARLSPVRNADGQSHLRLIIPSSVRSPARRHQPQAKVRGPRSTLLPSSTHPPVCCRCSRVFPCASCVKKGCAAICPDGKFRLREPLPLPQS